MSSYLGNIPSNNFVSLKRQVITGNGGASYTLDYSVASVNDVAIFVNNVRQDPASYSISGTALTLGDTISSSDSCYIIFLGQGLQTVTPANNTITNAMLSETITVANGGTGVTSADEIGNFVKLASTTASSASNVDFNSTTFSTDYKMYKIIIQELTVSTASALEFLVSNDNGSTFDNSSSQYTRAMITNDHTDTNDTIDSRNQALDNGSMTVVETISANSEASANFQLDIYGFNQTGKRLHFFCHGVYRDNSNSNRFVSGSIQRNVAPTTAYNAIRIQPSTGTISGNFVVYGVKF